MTDTTSVDNNTLEELEQHQQEAEVEHERQDDLIGNIFESQLTTMMLSTFIIAVVGIVIGKLRNFKKKFDMVEVIVRVQAKMKTEADKRERELENRMIKFEERNSVKIKDLYDKIDETNINIDKVKDEATKALIDFLSRKKD